MTRQGFFLATFAFAISAAIPGCGGDNSGGGSSKGLHPVKGKVKSDVGSAAGLTIVFFPSSPGSQSSNGEVQPDGTFSLYTRVPGDGASDGDFKIYFNKPLLGRKNGPSLPNKYFSPDSTDLTATIKPDTTDVGILSLSNTPAKK